MNITEVNFPPKKVSKQQWTSRRWVWLSSNCDRPMIVTDQLLWLSSICNKTSDCYYPVIMIDQ